MGLCVVAFALSVGDRASAQNQRKREAKKKEQTYTRPNVSKPIKPTIPSANRYRTDRVFLEKADSLFRLPGDTSERQIVKGNVEFRQGGMFMYCDSAYYYASRNSLDAFGHVKMEQGDTLFVYADRVYYDGNERIARLRGGASRRDVKLVDRDVTLTTDSLDYSLAEERGWYLTGGRLEDKENVLVSLFGEYSTATKWADFYHDVVLTNNRDGYVMQTDTLHYNTRTAIARISAPTRIMGENDTILTHSGWYNTRTDSAELVSRSTIIHRDSTGNVTTLEGDSIVYDKASRISRAFMFAAPGKRSVPMVLTDTAHSTILIGGYGLYNDSTGEALAADYPLLMEYSRPDTLFLRADTIRTFLVTDTIWRTVLRDTAATAELPMVALAAGITVEPDGDELADEVISERPLDADFPEQPADSVPVERTTRMAEAYLRARFFNKDIQGVADTIIVAERDSMLFMRMMPVVWSGERQVAGKKIDVHFNDSTADWARLPEGGMMSEHIDEDFYNQLAGKDILAWFGNETLTRLEVSGNVQTVFLPMEKDSTYNRLVTAESSFLTIDMVEGTNDLERLKMWPEVTGSVAPIFAVKRSQQYLPGFVWLERIRPRREWYGGSVHWADDLGEVPEELEEYFASGRSEAAAPVRRRAVRKPMEESAALNETEEGPAVPDTLENSENREEDR